MERMVVGHRQARALRSGPELLLTARHTQGVPSGETDNVELVRRGYEAFNRGDLDAVLELFDPAVELGVLEDSLISGEFHGHEGFRELLAENSEMFAAYRNEPEEIVEVSERSIVVVVRSLARGRISGAAVEGRLAHLWTIRDGRVIRFQAFSTREAALDAAAGD
jgi:ketosteroid isomerase-like protein